MKWFGRSPMEPRGSMELEQLDRRAFLRGMMVTSAGLLVPKPLQVAVPRQTRDQLVEFIDAQIRMLLKDLATTGLLHDSLYQINGRIYTARQLDFEAGRHRGFSHGKAWSNGT